LLGIERRREADAEATIWVVADSAISPKSEPVAAGIRRQIGPV
jgi:hypothetical protein